MATFSITTTAAQDAAAIRYVAQLNATIPAPSPPITAVGWARGYVLDKLNALVNYYLNVDNVGKAELYQRASDADKATIDAILATYR